MPSVSKKQHNFMEMIAHGGKARKKGPSVAVAKEFVAADQATGKFKGNAARHANLKALLKSRKKGR